LWWPVVAGVEEVVAAVAEQVVYCKPLTFLLLPGLLSRLRLARAAQAQQVVLQKALPAQIVFLVL
jgi:hypothetical protein